MHKVLVISHSYPLNLAPFKAKFIQDQVLLFEESEKFLVEVLNLTPKTVPFTNRHKQLNNGYKSYGETISKETYLSIPKRKFPNFIKANISRTVLQFLNKKKYDLIHLHWLYPTGLTIKALKEAGYKVVLTVHGSDWYQPIQNDELRKLVTEALFEVDQILFSGPQLRNDFLGVVPELKHKTQLIYNSVDSNFYRQPTEPEILESKRKISFNENKINILSIASIREEKGIDILLEAINQLENTNLHFHIVGLIENTPYSDSVFERVKELNLESQISFHGLKTPRELLDFYFASDFYLLPSRREGFNLSILESSAVGLPVLCTDVGGNKEVIDNKMGLVIPRENVDELVKGINYMVRHLNEFDPTYISKKTVSTFSEKMMLSRLSKIYSSHISS